MKPIQLLAVLSLVVFLSSCTKEYTCTCSSMNTSGDVYRTWDTKAEFDTRSDAKDWCEANEVEYTLGVYVACDLN